MKSYNASLDKLTMAIAQFRGGNPLKAAKMFASACKDPSVRAAAVMFEKYNAAASTRTNADFDGIDEIDTMDDIQADSGSGNWPFDDGQEASVDDSAADSLGPDTDESGDELRMEPDLNAERAVQTADTDEMVFEDDMSADADMDMSDLDLAEDDEGEIDMAMKALKAKRDARASAQNPTLKVSASQPTATARMARALYNLRVQAAKKVVKKKPLRKK